MDPTDLAVALHQYGGWGLSAILMVVVAYLYKHNLRLNDDRFTTQKELNESMLQLVEKRIEADLTHAAAFTSLKDVVQKLIEKL